MLKFLIFILFFNSLQLFCQDNLGFKFGAGISSITKSYNNSNDSMEIKSSFSKNNNPAFSNNFGLYYLSKISEKSLIGLEFLINTTRDRIRVDYTEMYSNGTIITQTKYLDKKNITYFRIPLYYGYKIQKFSINAGINAQFALRSKGRAKGESISNSNVSKIDRKERKLKIDGYDFGPSFGLTYYFSEEISFEINYYNGLNNLTFLINNEKWKNKQLLLGFCYNLM